MRTPGHTRRTRKVLVRERTYLISLSEWWDLRYAGLTAVVMVWLAYSAFVAGQFLQLGALIAVAFVLAIYPLYLVLSKDARTLDELRKTARTKANRRHR